MSILYGILTSILASLGNIFRKKSINTTTMGTTLFSIAGPVFGFFLIYSLLFFTGFNPEIYTDYFIVTIILGVVFIDVLLNYLLVYVYKRVKLSYLLPYLNIDKLITIIAGFFIFIGTKNSTSIETFLISILAVFIIIGFSIDFNSLKIDKYIILFFIVKVLYAVSVLILGYIFLEYSSIDYISINIIFTCFLYFLILFLIKDNVKKLFNQSKEFYLVRSKSLIFGRSGFLLSLYLIQSAGVIIATLLGFIGLVIDVFLMKIILKDPPSKKQVILAFLILFLIGIGFYFK